MKARPIGSAFGPFPLSSDIVLNIPSTSLPLLSGELDTQCLDLPSRYNKLSRQIREIARKIRDLDPKDPFREISTKEFLEKLHSMGLINEKSTLEVVDKVTASSFCRRRLPVVLKKLEMAENLKAAVQFIEAGHVR